MKNAIKGRSLFGALQNTRNRACEIGHLYVDGQAAEEVQVVSDSLIVVLNSRDRMAVGELGNSIVTHVYIHLSRLAWRYNFVL